MEWNGRRRKVPTRGKDDTEMPLSKRRNCQMCNVLITNRYLHAIYCKKCSVVKESLRRKVTTFLKYWNKKKAFSDYTIKFARMKIEITIKNGSNTAN